MASAQRITVCLIYLQNGGVPQDAVRNKSSNVAGRIDCC